MVVGGGEGSGGGRGGGGEGELGVEGREDGGETVTIHNMRERERTRKL